MNKRPTTGKLGRPLILDASDVEALCEVVQAQPHATLDEVTRALTGRTGKKVCQETVRRALRRAGIQQAKPVAAPPSVTQSVPDDKPMRYGYTATHRRRDGDSGMNTDLTAAEWVLVADLFTRHDGLGRPVEHDRKRMLDACCYVVRTGCAWRLLPRVFRRGLACTRPSAAGRKPACLKPCMTACARNGVSAKGASPRQRPA